MMRRPGRLTVAVLVAALVAGGCGGFRFGYGHRAVGDVEGARRVAAEKAIGLALAIAGPICYAVLVMGDRSESEDESSTPFMVDLGYMTWTMLPGAVFMWHAQHTDRQAVMRRVRERDPYRADEMKRNKNLGILLGLGGLALMYTKTGGDIDVLLQLVGAGASLTGLVMYLGYRLDFSEASRRTYVLATPLGAALVCKF